MSEVRSQRSILMKNPEECFDGLSMNGKTPMISTAPPFVLRLSKDERRVFQQNQRSEVGRGNPLWLP